MKTNKIIANSFLTSVLLFMIFGVVVRTGGVYVTRSGDIEHQEIQIVNGKLILEGEKILEGFSVSQSHFSFLFYYIPEYGLWAISAREFDGSVKAGKIVGAKLEVELEGVSLTVESSFPIVSGSEVSVWGSLDREFKLDVESVLFGYGDLKEDAYEWRNFFDSYR